MRDARVPIAVNTQINRLSMSCLDDVLDVLVEERCHAWQIQLTAAMGRAADEPEVLLQPYDLLELFPKLAELKERAAASGNPPPSWQQHRLLWSVRACAPCARSGGHCRGCGAGQSTLGIEADGTIKACPSLPTASWAAGNIRDHSLRDIWERAEPMRYTRTRTKNDLWGFCRDCYYADVCGAGCTWTSEVLLGRPGNNPFCHHRALTLAERGQRERIVQTRSPEGVPFDKGLFEVVLESAR